MTVQIDFTPQETFEMDPIVWPSEPSFEVVNGLMVEAKQVLVQIRTLGKYVIV